MTLTEARAMCATLTVDEAQPEEDARYLEHLARWLVRFTPLVALDGENGLLLDITGCSHLFGGEDTMLETIHKALNTAGYTAHLGLAENRSASWALARFVARPVAISPSPEATQRQLAPLPVKALRLAPDMQQTLHRLGLKTIQSLKEIPRASLARRFRGTPSKQITALLTRLDQLSGRRDEPITPLSPLPAWQVRQAFSEPVLELSRMEAATQALLDDLCAVLGQAEQGARRLTLDAFRTDGSLQSIMIGTNQPTRDPIHLRTLFDKKLSTLTADFGFDLLILKAYEVCPLAPQQLGDRKAARIHSVHELLDRLTTRLGPHAVTRLQHKPSYIPEKAQAFVAASENSLDWDQYPDGMAKRPIRLLERPEGIDVLAAVPEGAPMRFRWRKMEHLVTKAQGPERISCEWWHSPRTITRDYYQVEVKSGSRFWLFRRGLYGVPSVRAAEVEQPDWFLHGFFA